MSTFWNTLRKLQRRLPGKHVPIVDPSGDRRRDSLAPVGLRHQYADTLIVSATTAGVTAIRPRNRNGSWIVEKVWETSEVEMYISHPVVIGDTLFGFSRRASGQLFALDARNGRVLWLGEPRFATNVAFATAGDLLFVLKDDAELIIAKASSFRFEPEKTYDVADSATWAQPVVSGRRLFVKDASTLTLWTFD